MLFFNKTIFAINKIDLYNVENNVLRCIRQHYISKNLCECKKTDTLRKTTKELRKDKYL